MIHHAAYRWHQWRHTRGKRDKDSAFRVVPAIAAILAARPELTHASVLTIGPRNRHEVGLLYASFARVDAVDLFPADPVIRRGDMHALPYADHTFGVVFLSHCLEHARDLRQATDEIARVLMLGGYVWIAVPRATSRNDHDRIVFRDADDVLTAFRRHFPVVVTELHRTPAEVAVLLRLHQVQRGAPRRRALVWLGSPVARRNWAVSTMPEALDAHGVRPIVVDQPEAYARWAWLRGRCFRTASFVSRERAEPTYAHKLSLRSAWRYRILTAGWRAVRALGLNPESVAGAIERRLPVSHRARQLLDETDPDVVLVGTSVSEGSDTEIIKAARARGVPVIAQITAWDTLTSKGAFFARPDALAVWGEQSARHAVVHHGFWRERVHPVGPIQWDGYLCPPGQPDDAASRDLPDRLILVAGTTVAYWRDEIAFVERLADRADDFKAHVWYRPHPVYGGRVGAASRPGLTVDTRGQGWEADPGLIAHYRAILTRSVAVVTAFSTMIVEAALFGVPSLVIGFGGSTIGHGGLLEHARYAHMAEVLRWPGVVICPTERDLFALLTGVCHSGSEFNRDALRAAAQRVARCDGHAAERLAEVMARYARGEKA